jgi:nucleoside 2-deoxyribosyltransferase
MEGQSMESPSESELPKNSSLVAAEEAMKVYIACPYTLGDVAINVRNALFVQDFLEIHGFMVYNPLLSHFQHLVFPHREVEYWYEKDIKWLKECDCVLQLPGESRGADREVQIAMDLNLPVYHSAEEVLEVNRWERS